MIVVLPFCNKDAQLACKNLEWMHELDGKTSYRCMLAYPEGTEQQWIDRMLAAAVQTFSDVHVFVYPDSDERTWPAGPNWSWQNVARYIPMITDTKGNNYPFPKIYPPDTPWLWLEADAIPMKPKWLDTLFDEYKRGGKPFMGHIVQDMGHMNGVGIYPNDVARYTTKPFMVVHGAFDVAMKEEAIEETHNANHLILHCWGLGSNDHPQHRGDDPVASFRDVGQMNRVLNCTKEEWELRQSKGEPVGPKPDEVLFHRCKDGSLIDCMIQARSRPEPQAYEVIDTIPEAVIPLPQPILEVQDERSETLSNTGWKKLDDAVYVKPLEYPDTEIFIVTYHKDAEFLKYSLYSIKKFASGFSGVTVVVPDRDVEIIEPICREWGPDNTTIETFTEIEGKGMLHHMALECSADQFCLADFFLHIDSDCIFMEPVTPADYFVGGKPVLLMESYERFRDKHPGVLRWKDGTEKAIGREISFEFMRRHPAVHYRDIYAKAREMVETHHKIPFLDWAVSGQNEYPQSWSDYNLLGAAAWIRGRAKYHWINVANSLPPKDKIAQFWSHGGLDRPTDTGAFVPDTPRMVIKRILGV